MYNLMISEIFMIRKQAVEPQQQVHALKKKDLYYSNQLDSREDDCLGPSESLYADAEMYNGLYDPGSLHLYTTVRNLYSLS
jgi:hypothetical protein